MRRNYAEDAVQRAVIAFLRAKGFLCTSQSAGLIKSAVTQRIANGLGYMKGSSDVIVWIPGGTINIEVKRPETKQYSFKTNRMIVANSAGKQSESQKIFEEKVKRIPGHHYIVVKDVQQLAEYISLNNIRPY